MKSTILQSLLSKDLGSMFLRELSRRMPTIYREAAHRSLSDENVVEPLKRYSFWQNRYFLAQSMFLRLGEECGYKATMKFCESNGFPIPMVRIGRFNFTLHHSLAAEEHSILSASVNRWQSSAINEKIMQPSLFEPIKEEELLRAASIYANIIFGTRSGLIDFTTYGFLQIGVPYVHKTRNQDGRDMERLRYAEKTDLHSILERVLEREKSVTKNAPRIKAVPKIKDFRLGSKQ